MIGFDDGKEKIRVLNDRSVIEINSNLASNADVTTATTLHSNEFICFMGPSPKASFDIDEKLALEFLADKNTNGASNSDVVRPVFSATDLMQKWRKLWTLDFGLISVERSEKYETPFKYLKTNVFPIRSKNRRESYAEKWWQYAEARPGMRRKLTGLKRFIATPGVAKHRCFLWSGIESLCNQGTLVFARDDDYFFGVLHSRLHEVWALKLGTRLETRPRYTPTTCFETFPLPIPFPGNDNAIAAAAKELDALRNKWLNPPEWTREEVLNFPGSLTGSWARYVTQPNKDGIGTVNYPRIVPADAQAARSLAKRTLTNLYNERPAWLAEAHRQLDEAVCDAYGFAHDLSDEQILEKLLALNLEGAGTAEEVKR